MAADTGPLLELQDLDSQVDRLRARLQALPEQQEADRIGVDLRRGEAALAQAAGQAAEARRSQDRLEGQLQALESKVNTVADRLYGRAGVVSSPKELQSLQADLDMLNRQKNELEEQVIGAMEVREEAAGLEKRTEEAVESLRQRHGAALESLRRARTEVEADLERAQAESGAVRPRVPAPVLALYDRIRAQSNDGVAAAALEHGVCQGCHQRLSNVEYEAARHSGDIARCEACRRILVIPG
jgi:predicted  nucleic acid-binding Zn-ribbon protein